MRSGRGQARCIIHGTVAALDSGPAHIIHQENQEQLDVFSRLSSTSLKSERDDPRRVSPALSLNQAENQHTWAQPGLVAYIALEPTGNISPVSTHLHQISIVISIALCLFINSGANHCIVETIWIQVLRETVCLYCVLSLYSLWSVTSGGREGAGLLSRGTFLTKFNIFDMKTTSLKWSSNEATNTFDEQSVFMSNDDAFYLVMKQTRFIQN